MNPLVEERLVHVLEFQVRAHCLRAGYYHELQIREFEDEKRYLLLQFQELSSQEAWWSDQEWDWFLSRALDFLEDRPRTRTR